LLSPLAEGADRLVAEVALRPEIGARLIAPLPMRKDMYEADFDEGSLKEFNRLLTQADQSFEIPLVAHEADVGHPGPARDKQYEAVGMYIARESQILIALWDGVKPGKVGGTAAIVEFQTEGLPAPDECNLLPPELFPVYHILTPRVSNPHPGGELRPFECEVIYSVVFKSDAKAAEKYYERMFGNLDDFNRLATKDGARQENEVGECKAGVIRDFDERNFSTCEARTLKRYAVADALANRFRTRMLWTHRALHWLVFLSFSCFVLFAHLHEHPTTVLAASLVLLFVGYLTHTGANWMGLDAKRLDYRAMAEGCRAGFFWQVAGVKASVPNDYLGRQRTEIDWICQGLRGWEIGLDYHPSSAWAGPKKRLQFVLEHWVADQGEYFRGAIKRSNEKSDLMERLVRACLIVAVLIGFGLFIATQTITYPPREDPMWLAAAIIAIDLLLAGAALLHHANQRMAHSEHLKQYRRMLIIFDNAVKSIQSLLDSGNVAGARACLRALGKEALIENGDWVLLHRERPLEIPHP